MAGLVLVLILVTLASFVAIAALATCPTIASPTKRD